MAQLISEFKEKYNLTIKESSLHGLGAPTTVARLLSAVLSANLSDIAEPGGIPPLLHAQSAATVKAPMFLQVAASRDATQPLRPCADMSEEEAFMLGSPGQAASNKHRLLKLVLTDGHLELPAVEMKTHLAVFRAVPIPGEKVIVNEGAEIRNGMLIITPDSIKPLGGVVEVLKKEFEFRKQRNAGALKLGGGDAAPKFQPFVSGRTETTRPARTSDVQPAVAHPSHDAVASSRGRGRGGAPGRGRGRDDDGADRSNESRGRGRGRGGPQRGGSEGGGRGGGSERARGRARGGSRGGSHHPDSRAGLVTAPLQTSQFPTSFVPAWNDGEDFPVLGDY